MRVEPIYTRFNAVQYNYVEYGRNCPAKKRENIKRCDSVLLNPPNIFGDALSFLVLFLINLWVCILRSVFCVIGKSYITTKFNIAPSQKKRKYSLSVGSLVYGLFGSAENNPNQVWHVARWYVWRKKRSTTVSTEA